MDCAPSRPELLLRRVNLVHNIATQVQQFRVRDRVRWMTRTSTTSLYKSDEAVCVGVLTREIADRCVSLGAFEYARSEDHKYNREDQSDTIMMKRDYVTASQRSHALAECTTALRDEGRIEGWRDELYNVVSRYDDEEEYCTIERAAAPIFGTKSYGVHLNGFVLDARNKRPRALWIGRRSKTKQTFPGHLDHIVAGGLTSGLTPMETAVKECYEEAGIPESIAKLARSCGAVSYETVSDRGLKRDVLFCFDLFLPDDFVPSAMDGEVQSFELWPIERVVESLLRDPNDERSDEQFKPNVALVIIDALLRNGIITPEERGYLTLLDSMRQGDCS